MPETNRNKINQFLLLTFGIAWAGVLYLKLSHIQFGTGEWMAVFTFIFMPAPAIAAFITQRIFHNQSLQQLGFTIKDVSWRWTLLYTPLLFLLLFFGALLVIYLLGNLLNVSQFGYLDFSNQHYFDYITKTLKSQGSELVLPIEKLRQMPLPFAPFTLFFGIILAYLVGYTINLPFSLGSELGWRGLLQQETRHWGFWKSNLFIGSIWGLWYGPIIMMGYNFPHYPIAGIGLMVLFCIILSFVLSYIRFKTKTVLGSAAFYGMLNTAVGILVLLSVSSNELFSSLSGIAGIAGGLMVLIYILVFDRKFLLDFSAIHNSDSDMKDTTAV